MILMEIILFIVGALGYCLIGSIVAALVNETRDHQEDPFFLAMVWPFVPFVLLVIGSYKLTRYIIKKIKKIN